MKSAWLCGKGAFEESRGWGWGVAFCVTLHDAVAKHLAKQLREGRFVLANSLRVS